MVDLTNIPIRSSQTRGIELNQLNDALEEIETALNGRASAAQGALADSAVQPGDNVSALTNDAGYLTSAPVGKTLTSAAQTISSTSYGTISGAAAFVDSTEVVIRSVLWLRFPTSSTSGTLLIRPSSSFTAPTLNILNGHAMGDQLTVASNDASTELTITVASTGSANLICPLEVTQRGETSGVTQFLTQIRKGSISSNFEVYRADIQFMTN